MLLKTNYTACSEICMNENMPELSDMCTWRIYSIMHTYQGFLECSLDIMYTAVKCVKRLIYLVVIWVLQCRHVLYDHTSVKQHKPEFVCLYRYLNYLHSIICHFIVCKACSNVTVSSWSGYFSHLLIDRNKGYTRT